MSKFIFFRETKIGRNWFKRRISRRKLPRPNVRWAWTLERQTCRVVIRRKTFTEGYLLRVPGIKDDDSSWNISTLGDLTPGGDGGRSRMSISVYLDLWGKVHDKVGYGIQLTPSDQRVSVSVGGSVVGTTRDVRDNRF